MTLKILCFDSYAYNLLLSCKSKRTRIIEVWKKSWEKKQKLSFREGGKLSHIRILKAISIKTITVIGQIFSSQFFYMLNLKVTHITLLKEKWKSIRIMNITFGVVYTGCTYYKDEEKTTLILLDVFCIKESTFYKKREIFAWVSIFIYLMLAVKLILKFILPKQWSFFLVFFLM